MAFHVDDAVYAHVSSQCTQVDIGARQVDHLIDQAVTPELSVRLLEQLAGDEMPSSVTMGITDGGEFSYTFAD